MIYIIADETTDHRDLSVLNILARIRNKVFIIDVLFLEVCNHQTLSQSIIKCVTTYGVQYNVIKSVVTDSAAYCKKAYRDVLLAIFTESRHILCLAHVINLVGEKLKNCACIAVDQILELVGDRGPVTSDIRFLLNFIAENCKRITSTLTSLEETSHPLPCTVINTIDLLKIFLTEGTTKQSFRERTEELLSVVTMMTKEKKKKLVGNMRDMFTKALNKLNDHLDRHPALNYYKAAWIFNPCQIGSLEHRHQSIHGYTRDGRKRP